jgi:hypothetical protein
VVVVVGAGVVVVVVLIFFPICYNGDQAALLNHRKVYHL